MKRTLILSAVVAALGGFLFGFDTAVISGTTDWLQRVFDLSSAQLGFTVASALIGTIVGALFIGKPTDKYGRRSVLFTAGLANKISSTRRPTAFASRSDVPGTVTTDTVRAPSLNSGRNAVPSIGMTANVPKSERAAIPRTRRGRASPVRPQPDHLLRAA